MTVTGPQVSVASLRTATAVRALAEGARGSTPWTVGSAIDIESVAAFLRCRLVPLAFTLDGSKHPYLGVLLPTPNEWHKYWILYDAEQPDTEVRYTIAHELGHAVLEQTGFRGRTTGRVDVGLEETCNRFADELLVPHEALKDSFSSPIDLVSSARTLLAPCYAVFRQAIRYYTAVPWSTAAGLRYRKGRLRLIWSVAAPGDAEKGSATLSTSPAAWEALSKGLPVQQEILDQTGLALYRQWATPADGNEVVVAVARTVRKGVAR